MSSTAPAEAGPRDVLDRLRDCLLRRSDDDLADLHSADAIYEFPFLVPGIPARYHGREEIRAGFRLAWNDRPVRVEEIHEIAVHDTSDPEVVIAELQAVATLTTVERPFTVPFLLVLRVRAGLLVHVRDYADALGAAVALDRLAGLVDILQQGR